MISKEFLSSNHNFKQVTQEDYIFAKGSFILRFSNLSEDAILEKRGGTLLLSNREIDIRYHSIGGFLDLIHEEYPDIEISLTTEIDLEDLDFISCMFICDFSNTKIIESKIVGSPIRISKIESYRDKLGSSYKVYSYSAYKTYSRDSMELDTDGLDLTIKGSLNDSTLSLTYRATDLNLYLINEVPLSSLGLEGLYAFM